ncbi:MAG: insulinase family protein [Bacteroidales bacterium]
MKKFGIVLFLGIIMSVMWACQPKEEFKEGEVYNGFKLDQKKFVEEVDANCLLFTHEKSGAQLMKIMAEDENKLFNIAFKTLPSTDRGTPHIIEHSVLNGSKNFPVKSPFEILTKGSLNTFLNAMTSSDWTTYPVASMNEKDYFNLMHVYLDAVFNPLLHEEDRIFEQEGWHYELNSLDDELTYKGVVYNEMKGAFSQPNRQLSYLTYKTLFPDNTYGVSSGGHPDAIPDLTIEHFRDFHKKYYHPTNSFILLYGNADLNKELEFINKEYLSNYEKSDEDISIQKQEGFEERKEVAGTYPVAENAETKDKTYLTYSFVFGDNTDPKLNFAHRILSQALVGHESAPLRLAIQEAGIGKNVYAYNRSNKQNVFTIGVENANPEDKEAFETIIFNTLKEVVKEGFDPEMLEGIVNRMEFSLREGNTPHKGMMYMYRTIPYVFFADDPYLGLEFEAPLADLKTGLEEGLLENIIQKDFLDNNFALLTLMKPEPGLEKKRSEEIKKELAEYKASLSEEERKDIVENTKALKAYQEEEDDPEKVAMVPMLELSDIDTEAEYFEIDEKTVDNTKVLHYNDFTNDILYSKLYFDLRVLPKEYLPYANLLSDIIGDISTEKYEFGELDNQLNIHTGGFNTYLNNFLVKQSTENFIPKFTVSYKATEDKESLATELVSEIINNTTYNDSTRLKTLLKRQHSNQLSFVNNSGINVALTRLGSYQTPYGAYNEMLNGYEYYQFIDKLMADFNENPDAIIEKLTETAELLFTKDNMIASVSCSDDNFTTYEKSLKALNKTMSDKVSEMKDWKFSPEVENEGMMAMSKVQYVTKGANFKNLGYQWDPKMKVLNQILSRDYLQTQIRVIGGAYGGFAGLSPSGTCYFASYRDPNLSGTLENFDATPDFLENFEPEEQEMTRFIIGTISKLDEPTTASQRGSSAVNNYFEQKTKAEAQAEREAILSTTPEDIRAFKTMIQDVLNEDIICVYGNDERIKENESIFDTTFYVSK